MSEKSKAKTIKFTILWLFIILIILWIAISVLFTFIFANFNGQKIEETLKIFTSLPFILYICAIILTGSLILYKIIITIKILDNHAVMNSEEINKMIAKNTAPIREKYYLLYNNSKQKDRKLNLLRKDLEKIYIKSKQNRTVPGGDKQ